MEKLRVREFKKLACDKFTTSKCQIWAADLGSLMSEAYLNYSITFSMDLANTSALNRGKQLQDWKESHQQCLFIYFTQLLTWSFKTENSLPKSSNLLSWLCVCPCTHSFFSVARSSHSSYSSASESSLGSSPISLSAPPHPGGPLSPTMLSPACVLSKQPAFILS